MQTQNGQKQIKNKATDKGDHVAVILLVAEGLVVVEILPIDESLLVADSFLVVESSLHLLGVESPLVDEAWVFALVAICEL